MPQTILGIDIGSYSVKIAEMTRSFKTFELVNFYERKIQFNEVLTPEQSMANALQTLIEDNIGQYDVVVTALPGQHVSTRMLDLPFGNVRKIDEAIEFEIENHVPFAIDDMVIDYHVSQSTKDSSKVLVVYARKGLFVKYLTMLNTINLDPRYICMEGVELANLAVLGMSPPDTSYALIDIGHSKTTVTVCRGKRLVYTRTIGIAGQHFTEAIQQKLNVPVDEAERFKIDTGQVAVERSELFDDLSKQVVDALEGSVDELIVQLRQTFFAYQNQENESVMGIFLSGGSSRMPGLDRYLSLKLRQNVTYLDCLQFHFNRIESSEVHYSVMPQALALALRGVAGGGLPDLNFRRGEFAYKGDVSQLGGGMKFVTGSLGAVAILGILYFGIQYYSLSRQIERVNTDVSAMVKQALPNEKQAAISSVSSALRMVKARKNDLSDRMSKLQSVVESSGLDMLKEISVTIPPREEMKLDVDTLTITTKQIKFDGRVMSYEDVDKITTAFEKKKAKFKNVNTSKSQKGAGNVIKFGLNMEPVIAGMEEKPSSQTPPSKAKKDAGKGSSKDTKDALDKELTGEKNGPKK